MLDIACPETMTADELLIWGLNYALEGCRHDRIPELLRPDLSPLLTQRIGETALPTVVVLQDHALKPNASGSFLGLDIAPFVDLVLGSDPKSGLAVMDRQ